MALETANKTSGTFSATGLSDWLPPRPSIQKNDVLRVELYGTTGVFTGTVSLVWGIDPGTTNGSTWKDTQGSIYTTTTSDIVQVGSNAFSHALQCTALTSGTIEYVLAR